MLERRFILLKINALRYVALLERSNTTVKEGHVNCDVSDVPVLAHADPTTQRDRYGWVFGGAAEFFVFVGCTRALMAALQPPPPIIEGRRT